MKIVFIGCRSLDIVGGIESYMLNLCTALFQRGIEPILYVGSDLKKTERMNGFTIRHVKINKNKYINKLMLSLFSTMCAIKEYPDADIYHFNANIAGLFSFLLIVMGKKTVYQGHGFEWKREKWSSAIRFFNKLVDYFVLAINKNILMCSKEQIDYVKKIFPSKKNIMLAPGGVFLPDPIYLSKLSKPLNGIPYILFLGRIVKEKRCDLLLSAFLKIQKKVNIDLVIAGPIEDETIVSPYYDNKSVHIIGAVFGDVKNAYMKNAHIYVIPSDMEGLSISLLEAMSYGCLCVASDIPANKEALDDTGLYFKKGDSNDLAQTLYECITYNHKYSFMKKMAYERIKKNYDWNILSENMIQYYYVSI